MNTDKSHNGSGISEGLAASARNLARSAEALLQNTADVSNEGIANLRSSLSESLRSAKAELGEFESDIAARGKQALAATDHYVHDKPWQAIAMAGLLGIVIGFVGGATRR